VTSDLLLEIKLAVIVLWNLNSLHVSLNATICIPATEFQEQSKKTVKAAARQLVHRKLLGDVLF
jgi:cytidylate kinase